MTWLDKWLTQFKEHIHSLAGKINRAKSGHVIRYASVNQIIPKC